MRPAPARWILLSDRAGAPAGLASVLRACGLEVVASAGDDADDLHANGVACVVDGQDFDAGLARLTRARRRRPSCAWLVLAVDVHVGQRRALAEAGAPRILPWPCGRDALLAALADAADSAPAQPAPAPPHKESIRGFVYGSPACARIAARLHAIAGCSATVLISGETGTGKELCAQAVHYLSSRSAGPWVAVNCGAIATELVENELFGHARGAYTTAHAASPGLVREAEGGTLFLDEVDSLPHAAQAKLLRFLQEREYRPVGSSTVVRADVRVIAASNSNLRQLTLTGRFRPDLFFRLNVLDLCLPPLRDRREDIALLAQHFVREFAREFDRPVAGLSARLLRRLVDYDWPGNVRELRHAIERAVLLASGPVLDAGDVSLDDDGAAAPAPQAIEAHESFRDAKTRVVNGFERAYVERLLTAHGGNVTHAAHAAKKDRRAFFELMRKHSIEPGRFRALQP